MDKAEALKKQVMESGPLIYRLEQCRERIGKMCKECRGPKMTIPVKFDDDDFYISTTIADAIKAIKDAWGKEIRGL